MDIPIELISDEKGYFDRECPNENCLYTFKIKMQDWKDKVSAEEVHCPMCGHIDTSEKWWTQAQLDSASKIASDYVMDMISGELDKIFGRLARSTRGNKFVKITYKPGKRISFSNNPIGQSEEWETEIECDKCGTRYSVIGSAYFCPCCGNNSAISVFDESLDSIEKMLESLGEMKELLTNSYGRDKAETMSRSLLESSLGDIVSAFQKFAECVYKQKSSEKVRVNDFQIVEKGSNLFLDATGKGYDEWLKRGIYITLLTEGKINAYLHEIDVQANEMTETIVANLARERGIDEELKASDAIKWVAEMNNIKASAEEIVLREVIYQ